MERAEESVRRKNRREVLAATLLAAYLAQAGYLSASHAPSLFYAGNVFLHVFGGAVLVLLAARAAWRALSNAPLSSATRRVGRAAWLLLAGSLVSGAALSWFGNLLDLRWLLWAHVGISCAGVLFALAALWRAARSGLAGAGLLWTGARVGVAVAAVALIAGAVSPPKDNARIVNPRRPPLQMEDEAMGGAEGPFFPSSARTTHGGTIPSQYFLEPEGCGRARCHPDIYAQWRQSAHRFSSFNNQWYRKSIEYMQEVVPVRAAKWCGGCHDHAVLFTGMMEQPVETYLDRPEAHAGLTCVSCHGIVGVEHTMGNGGFDLDFPPLHDLATSEQPVLRALHDLAVHLDPEPHRSVFLKPFHREQQAEFCSACHKVHLDRPVNHYRWIRGFNEYDNWQASGVSGQGARSFYYPPAPRVCGDCHMPLVPSADKGNRRGYVHDHSFPAANTALPLSHDLDDQLRRTIEFLQNRQVTVDIFAASPARPVEGGEGTTTGELPQLASTFAVGEEAAAPVGRGSLAALEPSGPVWAPLDRIPVSVRRGEEVRVDVVVRTRNVGHFFPGGTVDAFDVWVELRAADASGRTVFWSGPAHDNGEGPVDPGAHFYRALLVDAHGNPIDKRNAWASRAVVYVRLIPPGAADVARFRLRVPEDAPGPLHLEARLNYRKFSYANTRFAFAGRPAPGEPARTDGRRVTPDYDDRRFETGPVPHNVSAARREIPVLPIVVLDRATATLELAGAGEEVENPEPSAEAQDAERWNDYGIGLLLQGDLKGAERAFEQVILADPDWPEGHVNVARARLQGGDLDGAQEKLERALRLSPDLAKAHYFLGVVLKERGEYDIALAHLRRAAETYPRDRVVRNTIGRVLFLQRRFEEAVTELERVLEIDPEDLMAHYNLMLCYRGLGRAEEAEIERRLYERFKADEDSQMITGPYRREHPLDNRERQRIHEHPGARPEVLAREVALRAGAGEPHVVLPGEVEAYLERVRARRAAPASRGGSAP